MWVVVQQYYFSVPVRWSKQLHSFTKPFWNKCVHTHISKLPFTSNAIFCSLQIFVLLINSINVLMHRMEINQSKQLRFFTSSSTHHKGHLEQTLNTSLSTFPSLVWLWKFLPASYSCPTIMSVFSVCIHFVHISWTLTDLHRVAIDCSCYFCTACTDPTLPIYRAFIANIM